MAIIKSILERQSISLKKQYDNEKEHTHFRSDISEHKTIVIPVDYTEEQLMAFVEENLTRVLKAARLDKMYTALDDIQKDFND